MKYPISAFEEIEAGGFDYSIPPEIVKAIQRIAGIVGAVPYSPTPVFPKPDKKGGRLGEVVGLLNKLTADSYDKIAGKVVDMMGHLDPSETDKFCETVFTIASGNRFYSKIYANLCKELCKYEGFKALLDARCAKFSTDLATTTAEGRALTLFVTHLAINGSIALEIAVSGAQQLQALVEANLDEASKKEQIEEWSEHLALMLTLQKGFTAACGLQARMVALSKTPPKARAGVSIKTVFRYMDMVEHFH